MANQDLAAFMAGTELVGGTQQYQSGGTVRRIAAGVPKQAVAAGAAADLAIVVSEHFRPDRIVLSVAAQALDVSNVKIGTKSLNVTSNPISGNCFAQDAINTHLEGYTAQAGIGFVISVTNPTAGSITTGGGVFGPALTP